MMCIDSELLSNVIESDSFDLQMIKVNHIWYRTFNLYATHLFSWNAFTSCQITNVKFGMGPKSNSFVALQIVRIFLLNLSHH